MVPDGRVLIAACVRIQRIETHGNIKDPAGQTKECIVALSSVAVRVPSIRRGHYRLRCWLKGKAGERERDEKQTEQRLDTDCRTLAMLVSLQPQYEAVNRLL